MRKSTKWHQSSQICCLAILSKGQLNVKNNILHDMHYIIATTHVTVVNHYLRWINISVRDSEFIFSIVLNQDYREYYY